MATMEELERELIAKMKAKHAELKDLLDEVSSPWGYEDPIYRFYHQSFKVYGIQDATQKIVHTLRTLAPGERPFCSEFQEIIDAGASGKRFEREHNRNWSFHTRPFLEAFFHARFFLEMAIKYSEELEVEKPPETMPSGWAALRCLFQIPRWSGECD